MAKKKRQPNPLNQLFFALTWICLSTALVLLGTAAYSWFFLEKAKFKKPVTINHVLDNYQKQSNNENNGQAVNSILETQDARSELLTKFLERHNSPMKPYDFYGQKLVEIADRYSLDFRFLPAIAMQESNLCKTTNPNAPHNCLGFGIHSRGTLDFASYEAGFERAARELKQNYIDQGLDTVTLIESKYTPSSNGSWANSVNQWMAEIRYNDRDKGRSEKINTHVLEFAVNQDAE